MRATGFDQVRTPVRHSTVRREGGRREGGRREGGRREGGRSEGGELGARRHGALRRLLPRWTLRLRLTLLYGALFMLTGAVLLGITYGLVAQSVSRSVAVIGDHSLLELDTPGALALRLPQPLSAKLVPKGASFVYGPPSAPGALKVQLRKYAGQLQSTAQDAIRGLSSAGHVKLQRLAARANAQLVHQRGAQLDALLTKSGVALGIMAFVSIGLGWLMAGRALRPVRTMNARARRITERNLHERLAPEGPEDELKELGDTFDGLLSRLEGAFESQRRFVANASHELRTPITLQRTLVEVALSDPDATTESLRATCERVIVAGEHQERLIESLLTLARSQRGVAARERLELDEVAGEVLDGAEAGDVRIEARLEPARTTGDPALVERLVANLIDNALHYNRPRGWIRVSTGLRNRRAVLEVSNAGPAVGADEVELLFEPFRRQAGERSVNPAGPTAHPGLGLGLSIVEAIADAHGAVVTAIPRSEGGLRVQVSFRAVPVALAPGAEPISDPAEHDPPPAAYASGA